MADFRRYDVMGKEQRAIITEQIEGSARLELCNNRCPDTPWVARITGSDPRFKYRREFIQPTEDNLSRRRNGTQTFVMEAAGLYEIAFQDIGGIHRRFLEVLASGEIRTVKGGVDEVNQLISKYWVDDTPDVSWLPEHG